MIADNSAASIEAFVRANVKRGPKSCFVKGPTAKYRRTWDNGLSHDQLYQYDIATIIFP
jgi:hypothetical protein